MALERLDILVRAARARSGNQEYGDSQGVPQRDFVAYANDAQDRIFNLMMQRRPSLFVKEGFLTTQSGVASYALPSDVYLGHNVLKVEYTPNGDAQLYSPLSLTTPRAEVTIPGLPDSYFLRDGRLIVSPKPSTGYANALRLNYQYVIPRVDIRRAKIDSVNTGAGTITLTDDTTLTEENVAELTGGWVDYVCVVDKDGAIIDQDRAFSSYNSTTRVLTLTTLSGSLAASNQYVVFGKNTTTHSSLPDVCRRYLLEYMTLRGQMSDTSSEAQATSPLLQSIEREILDAIESLEEDIFSLTILDQSMLNYAESWE